MLALWFVALLLGEPGGGPLHAAVLDGSLEATKAALDDGESFTARDSLGYTALHRAVEEGHAELVTLLLARGAAKGDATSSDNLPIRGKSIDSRDNNAATALMLAAGGGHIEMIRTLVDAGADLRAGDEFGLTPLHYAAEGGHADAVSTLLSLGSDPDASDELGKTAADVASAWGFPEVAALLGPTVTVGPASPPAAVAPPTDDDAAPAPGKRTTKKHMKMPDNLQPEKLEL